MSKEHFQPILADDLVSLAGDKNEQGDYIITIMVPEGSVLEVPHWTEGAPPDEARRKS